MVRKIIFGIFISVCFIFAMSHNVSALNVDFNNYEIKSRIQRPSIVCSTNIGDYSGTICTPKNTSSTLVNTLVYSIKLRDTAINLSAGDLVEFYLFVDSNFPGLDPSDTININDLRLSGDIYLLDFSEISGSDFERIESSYSNNVNQNIDGFNISNLNITSKIYKFTAVARNNANNVYIGLDYGSTNGYVFSYYDIGQLGRLSFKIPTVFIYSRSESKENKEVEQKTQDAVDQSTSDGNSSQSSVEGSTQSLMSAGASIMSALTSAPATDCNINIQTTGSSRLFTTAIGQLNLCSDVPQGVLNMVQSIVALVFTPIVLYFTYNVITTLYNQFKEYNS